MKRLMVIGASPLQLPAIKKAKEMGLCVAVADYDSHAVGIPYADKYYEVSTIDEEGIFQAAKDFHADGIMTIATDMPMRSVAYAVQKLNLVGISYDTAIKSTDKGKMIEAFEKSGVEHPWYYILSQPDKLKAVIDSVTYPCISKPLDNAGSRGVILINSRSELEGAVKYSSSNGRKGGVIVEEYLQGNEVSVEVISVNGEVFVLQVTDKLTTGAPHFVEMGHSQPSALSINDIAAIKDLAIRAVKSVGIDNGPAHVEIMLTEKGPRMIELGARMGGDCITSHLVPLSTGIDMVKASIQIALGEAPDIEQKLNKGSAIRFLGERNGTIESICGIEQAQKMNGIHEVLITKSIGDNVGKLGSSVDRLGAVIAQGGDAAAAIQYCEDALSVINISMK